MAPGRRGTRSLPANRFERLVVEPEAGAGELPDEGTEVYLDRSRTILSRNESPDLPFDWSVNPYRGCEHGCVYCYARPYHEYLGWSAGLDFERRILAKPEAPALFERALAARGWKGEPVSLSGVTDPYQPVEKRLRLTRGILEKAIAWRQPIAVITKSALVERDADLLADLASIGCAHASLSLTTLDADLAARLEPRASLPARRLRAIRSLSESGVWVHASIAPVVPGLNEHEIPALLRAAAEAGASSASFVLVRLPPPTDELLSEWLERNRPLAREKVLARIRRARGGRLDDRRFGARMRGEGRLAAEIADLFGSARARAGLAASPPPLRSDHFGRPGPRQGTLFG